MFNKHVGRSMLANAERLGIIPPEVYGSRRNHRAIECVLHKVLTADLSRQCRVPLALCSNDAVSCYDRIIHSVASLCMQRLGVPKNQCHLLFGTLQQVEHYVRTTYGDSATGYAGVLLQPLQGVGRKHLVQHTLDSPMVASAAINFRGDEAEPLSISKHGTTHMFVEHII